MIEINNIIEYFDITLSGSHANSEFKFAKITTDEVIKILQDFKYKIGGRKILSDGVIKDSIMYTGYFYAQIINSSLEDGIVPEKWKMSTVIPVEKVKRQYNQKSSDP